MISTSRPERVSQSCEFVPSNATIWQKYNNRLEIPISFASSGLVFTFLIFLLSLFLWHPWSSKPRAVQISLCDGLSLFGEGSPDAAGVADPAKQSELSRTKAIEPTKPLPPLEGRNPNSPINVGPPEIHLDTPGNFSRDYQLLDEALRNRLLGQSPGNQPAAGSSAGPQKKAESRGTGADSATGRSLRWVMKFNVRNGQDYVSQLGVLKASIIVPVPLDNKKMMLFDHLRNPKPGQIATEKDIDRLSKLVRFSDSSDEAVKEISKALGIKEFVPKTFFAFFPREFEEELARKEKEYQGKKPEEVEETKFRVTVKRDKYTIEVVEQKLKN
ncbi:MAG TPA: hypothetical protein VGJ05_02960 [Fimbriiglobus sp.]